MITKIAVKVHIDNSDWDEAFTELREAVRMADLEIQLLVKQFKIVDPVLFIQKTMKHETLSATNRKIIRSEWLVQLTNAVRTNDFTWFIDQHEFFKNESSQQEGGA